MESDLNGNGVMNKVPDMRLKVTTATTTLIICLLVHVSMKRFFVVFFLFALCGAAVAAAAAASCRSGCEAMALLRNHNGAVIKRAITNARQ